MTQQAKKISIDVLATDRQLVEPVKQKLGTKKCTTLGTVCAEGHASRWVRTPSVFQLLRDAALRSIAKFETRPI